MPLTAEEMRQFDAAFAKQGLDFGSGGSTSGLPTASQVPVEAAPTDSFVHAGLKGALSGYTGELADLAARLTGNEELMRQDPNQLLPYRIGYLGGSLLGLPQKLGLGAANLVGSRLLSKLGTTAQTAITSAAANAALGGISAAGQGEEVLPAIETNAVLGGTLGVLAPKIGPAINKLTNRRTIKVPPATSTATAPVVAKTAASLAVKPIAIPGDEIIPMTERGVPPITPEPVRPPLSEQFAQIQKEGEIAKAYFAGDPEVMAQAGIEPAAVLPTAPVPVTNGAKTFVMDNLAKIAAKDPSHDYSAELKSAGEYFDAISSGAKKADIPTPKGPAGPLFKQEVDKSYKQYADDIAERLKSEEKAAAVPTPAEPLASVAPALSARSKAALKKKVEDLKKQNESLKAQTFIPPPVVPTPAATEPLVGPPAMVGPQLPEPVVAPPTSTRVGVAMSPPLSKPMPTLGSEPPPFEMAPTPAPSPTAPLPPISARDLEGLPPEQVNLELNRRMVTLPDEVLPETPNLAAPVPVATKLGESTPPELTNEYKAALKKLKFVRESVKLADPEKPFTVDKMLERLTFEQKTGKQQGRLAENMQDALDIAKDPAKMAQLSPVFRNRVQELADNWQQAQAKFNLGGARETVVKSEVDDVIERMLLAGKSREEIADDLAVRLKAKLDLGGQADPNINPETGMFTEGPAEGLMGKERGGKVAKTAEEATVEITRRIEQLDPERAGDLIRRAYAAPVIDNIHPRLRKNAKLVFGRDDEAF